MELKVFCERMPTALETFTKEGVEILQLQQPSERRRYRSYDHLFEGLNNFNWRIVRNSTHTFLVTYGACFEVLYNGNQAPSFKLLFVTVAPRKHAEYLKLCWLTGREPNKAILEVWESPDFDVTNSVCSSLRSQYLKRFKKPAIAGGFESFFRKENLIQELYATIELPSSIQTIDARSEWIRGASRETLEALRSQRDLSNSRVTLSF
jgi:hypothetical protein